MAVIIVDEDPGPGYVTCFSVVQIFCKGCRSLITPKSPPRSTRREIIPSLALAVHKATGTICTNPQLAISFSEQLVDERLLDQPVIVTATASGE